MVNYVGLPFFVNNMQTNVLPNKCSFSIIIVNMLCKPMVALKL